jgi:hypothetical protein
MGAAGGDQHADRRAQLHLRNRDPGETKRTAATIDINLTAVVDGDFLVVGVANQMRDCGKNAPACWSTIAWLEKSTAIAPSRIALSSERGSVTLLIA